MGYENKIQEKVKQHPLTEFSAIGDLSEMDNYGDQFAELLNSLSTNIIIPTTDETALKQWAADYADGERIYAEIDGKIKVAEATVDSPSGASDIELKSVGGSSSPSRAVYSTEQEINDVSSHNKSADFNLRSSKGGSSTVDWVNFDDNVFSNSDQKKERAKTAAGKGISVTVSIDCSKFDTLKTRFYAGGASKVVRKEFSQSLNNPFKAKMTFGSGGTGAAILDGDDNIVVGVSGGTPAVVGSGTYEWDHPTYYNIEYYNPASPAGGLADKVSGGDSTRLNLQTAVDWNFTDAHLKGSPSDGDVSAPSSHAYIKNKNIVDDSRDPVIESFVE